MKRLTVKYIAAILGCSKQNITKRATFEGWTVIARAKKGEWIFDKACLPVDIQTAIDRAVAPPIEAITPAQEQPAVSLPKQAASPILSPQQQTMAEAKGRILRAYQTWGHVNKLSDRKARETFSALYSQGETTSIYIDESIKAVIPRLSSSVLYKWLQQQKHCGLASLGKRQGKSGPKSRMEAEEDLRNLVLGMLFNFPQCSVQDIDDAVCARFGKGYITKRSLERYVRNWKSQNAQVWTYISNPDQWKSQYMAASGNVGEQIIRLNQRWEFDSTKADLMLAHGKRATIVGVIDVYSRKAGLLVCDSSTASAVASLLRQKLLEWGVPEIAVTDNGADYVSNHIKNAFLNLNIYQKVCEPFKPEQKPFIERFFKTFSHGLLKLQPGYVGHNVAARQAIEAQRSFASRLMQPGEKIELNMTKDELQGYCDEWLNNTYHHKKHSSLQGKTPWEMAAAWSKPIPRIEDEDALKALLMPLVSNGGVRIVTKKGISINDTQYVSPDFAGYEGQAVIVRQDVQDLGVCHVYSSQGQFICEATSPVLTGIDGAEVAAMRKQKQSKLMAEQRKELKAAARQQKVAHIAEEIRRDKALTAGKLRTLPQASIPYVTAALEEAAKAVQVRQTPEARSLTLEEQATLQEIAKPKPAQVISLPETPEQRYSRWRALDARIKAGEKVSLKDETWHQTYQETVEFKTAPLLEKMHKEFSQAMEAQQ